MEREYELYEFAEGPSIQRFDPEGIFVSHLNFVYYTNLSNIFVPHEIEENRILETIISTNVKQVNQLK